MSKTRNRILIGGHVSVTSLWFFFRLSPRPFSTRGVLKWFCKVGQGNHWWQQVVHTFAIFGNLHGALISSACSEQLEILACHRHDSRAGESVILMRFIANTSTNNCEPIGFSIVLLFVT